MGRAIRTILGPGLGLGLALSLAGCATLPWQRPAPQAAPEAPAVPSSHPRARPAPAPVLAPGLSPAAPASLRQLGTTVASLGSPARPGLWLRTPLVAAETPGRVAVGGKSLAVTLIPLPGPRGGGSQLSLAAYRALGLPLTALPELTVSGP
ncbi:hypothetical protein [Acidimangrovimonas pyrenivorans]|uniref:D-galactarate dehydratase n=1 Tax=Acidimangrovimonas pyrenivorans TaxID=2030798 RepID=A0ABV7AFN2_9RHOB